MKKKIEELIEAYAKVYKGFEELQKKLDDKQNLLPGGDQKTGVIAEYYAKCYIEHTFKNESAKYADPGAPYDIAYTNTDGKEIRVQVKGVSAHSQTRIIAPLNLKVNEKGERPFDELFLIDLNMEFLPVGFYINSYDEILERTMKSKERIVGSTMKEKDDTKNDNPKKKGSVFYDFSNCKVEDMKKALKI